MAIRNIIDGTFSVNGDVEPPVIATISVPTITAVPYTTIPITFMKVGNMCTMTIGPFNITNNSTIQSLTLDMSSSTLNPFKPSTTITMSGQNNLYQGIILNNGDNVLWSIFSWNVTSKQILLTPPTKGSAYKIIIDNAQSINYITN